MKLSFDKNELLKAIQTVQSSISTKSTLAVLSNFLLKAEPASKGSKPTVRMEATDLEVGVRTTVKAEIEEPGRGTIPAKKFAEMVRELPDGKNIEVSTSEDQKKITIRCGKVRAMLHTLAPEDYPAIPEFPRSSLLKFKKSVFLDMLRKSSFAVSTDETRHALNGIYFVVKGTEVKMVATDGRRLAMVTHTGSDKHPDASVIIPSKATNELARLLSIDEDGDDDIAVAPASNQVAFQWKHDSEEVVLVSRLIEGNFPNYEQVIPKGKDVELRTKTADLLSAVRRAALFAQDRGGSARISLKTNSMRISANTANLGDEEEELDAEYKGPEFEIAFNPQFLMDILKNTAQPEVQFEFTTPLNPGLVKPVGDDNYLCVVMPMRLQ